MKKLVLSLVLCLVAAPVFAGGHNVTFNTTINNSVEQDKDNAYGAMLDAPNLVVLRHNWSLGVEGGKNFNGTSSSEGYFAFAKATWNGNLLDFSNKGE